jgi:hypothetical protein
MAQEVAVIALRWLGNFWGSVNTLAGLLAWLTSWSRFSHTHGGAIVLSARGWAQFFMQRANVAAFCWGSVICVNRRLAEGTVNRTPYFKSPSGRNLLRHELAHVRQSQLFGPFLVVAYGVGAMVAMAQGGHPYTDNFLEKWARRAEVEP